MEREVHYSHALFPGGRQKCREFWRVGGTEVKSVKTDGYEEFFQVSCVYVFLAFSKSVIYTADPA